MKVDDIDAELRSMIVGEELRQIDEDAAKIAQEDAEVREVLREMYG